MKNSSTESRISKLSRLLSFIALGTILTSSAAKSQGTVIGSCTLTGNVNFRSSNNWADSNRCMTGDDWDFWENLPAGETSKYLEVVDFGYLIPRGAVVDGIEVRMEGHQESFWPDFADAYNVILQNGVAVGTDHAGTGYHDGSEFPAIGAEEAAGNSAFALQNDFQYKNEWAGIKCGRLQQLVLDGNTTYSVRFPYR